MAPNFMFATGIENSYPTIHGGRTRVDEMGQVRPLRPAGGRTSTWCRNWASAILRYGPPIHRTWLGEGRYDWSFADETFGDLCAA